MNNINSFHIHRLKNFLLWVTLVLLPNFILAQVCNTDSNYYSIRYFESYNLFVKDALRTSQNQMVALSQNQINETFISRFTQQGNVLWSNEYHPDYPHASWMQYPWYSDTKWTGLAPASDSGFFAYGSAIEHGALINNEESPAKHLVGLLMKLDKFGNIIYSKYFGNWGTSYTIEKIVELNNGNLVVFLRSHFEPFKSKVICVDIKGNVLWGAALQLWQLYREEASASPQITQMSNGNIAVMSQVMRTVADTLVYPFLTVIIPGPLQFFNFVTIDSKTGNIISHTSFEGPALTGSNVSNQFVMQAKSLTALPNGDISLCADMYIPIDQAVFYRQKVFSKRAINFIADRFGLFKSLTIYAVNGDGACSLESVAHTGNGEQTLLIKDSASGQLSLVAINTDGTVKSTKSYTGTFATANTINVALKKTNSNGYSIFQSDADNSSYFNLMVTNAEGNTGCASSTPLNIVSQKIPWPWPADKVIYLPASANVDFGYSPFTIKKKPHPLQESTYCNYQFECCKNVIDSLNVKDIFLCPNQTFTLPDSTVIRESGAYYAMLKKTDGCDSVIFYNVKMLKSPAEVKVTSDTCLSGATALTLHASGGYDNYVWNSFSSTDSTYEIHAEGAYAVTVKNTCGVFSDTIFVSDKCDYPIYFPNAFTPNFDNLNDLLRVPSANKNKLIRLAVYNQWGQLLFSTTQPNLGWDGTYKGQPQPIGLYVYFLEMQGLTGNKLSQKGTVTLLR